MGHCFSAVQTHAVMQHFVDDDRRCHLYDLMSLSDMKHTHINGRVREQKLGLGGQGSEGM